LRVRSLAQSQWHVGFYQDTILRLVNQSLRAALTKGSCGAAMTDAASPFGDLRTLFADSLRPKPLLTDSEIAAGRLLSNDATTGRLIVEYRDELVAWRFWKHAALVDSCIRVGCSTTDPGLQAALRMNWRPLASGRYDLSTWYDGRWWRARRIGGDFVGSEPLVTPGLLSFDFVR
jgi:hypothetical protein